MKRMSWYRDGIASMEHVSRVPHLKPDGATKDDRKQFRVAYVQAPAAAAARMQGDEERLQFAGDARMAQ